MAPSLRQRVPKTFTTATTSVSSIPLVGPTTTTTSSTTSTSHSQSKPDAFIEVESDLLHNMQDTLEESISRTNETVAATWRSTKASANETIRVVENQMSETWDASKAAFEGAKRLLRFEELPKEWQSNPYIFTGETTRKLMG
ncbi:hypothetical protein BGZ76_010088 [Entomortierella beljakovae]|nr:hypothetical protein BGZ76_010088 [Entomortierella beljakovae]